MTDRVPGAPGQYKAVVTEAELLKMQSGEEFTITMTRDDQPITEGTPYSKAAVLPDELAAQICPDMEDPTPADAFRALHDRIYPVGAIYMSLNATNPGTLFGGTWERITDVFLFAANSTNGYAAGSTGGEASHTLTVEEMPNHNHNIRTSNSGVLDRTVNTVVPDSAWSSQFGGDHTEAAGGGQAHNNMPPYLAVYMWQRTA